MGVDRGEQLEPKPRPEDPGCQKVVVTSSVCGSHPGPPDCNRCRKLLWGAQVAYGMPLCPLEKGAPSLQTQPMLGH